jgi:hydrogenase small subunit
MHRRDDGLYAALVARGMSRRSFLRFSAAMATALALPASYGPRIARAVETAPRLPLVWLRGQACGGDSEAFLRAADPTVSELILELLSVEYHESLMAPAGAAADPAAIAARGTYPDGYLAVVEGSVPTADDGVHCAIAGRALRDVVSEVSDGAIATIAVGSCAVDGGLSAAAGGGTGAASVAAFVPNDRLISLPGCPLNVENLTATLVHYLAFKELPPTDGHHRPLAAYGALVHNQCERRAHFEFGEFVLAWGDEGAQKGWCLYKMGCKGPETYANCPTKGYAQGLSWPVKAGHGCVGCTMPGFWDSMSPFYGRLPAVLPFAPNVSADQIGTALVGSVAALGGVHAVASYVRHKRLVTTERREALAAAAAAAPAPEAPGREAPTGESGAPGWYWPTGRPGDVVSGGARSTADRAGPSAAADAPPAGTPPAGGRLRRFRKRGRSK